MRSANLRWIFQTQLIFYYRHLPSPNTTVIGIGKCIIVLGKHERQRKESTQLIAKVADYFIHPDWMQDLSNPETSLGPDVALLKLTKPLKFTDAIQPICLPSGLSDLPYNKTCYATGWGSETNSKYHSGDDKR